MKGERRQPAGQSILQDFRAWRWHGAVGCARVPDTIVRAKRASVRLFFQEMPLLRKMVTTGLPSRKCPPRQSRHLRALTASHCPLPVIPRASHDKATGQCRSNDRHCPDIVHFPAAARFTSSIRRGLSSWVPSSNFFVASGLSRAPASIKASAVSSLARSSARLSAV